MNFTLKVCIKNIISSTMCFSWIYRHCLNDREMLLGRGGEEGGGLKEEKGG